MGFREFLKGKVRVLLKLDRVLLKKDFLKYLSFFIYVRTIELDFVSKLDCNKRMEHFTQITVRVNFI